MATKSVFGSGWRGLCLALALLALPAMAADGFVLKDLA